MARGQKGVSQKELARQVGTTSAAISSWELGKAEPDNRHFRAVTAALGLSIEQVMTELDQVVPGRVAEPAMSFAAADLPRLPRRRKKKLAPTAKDAEAAVTASKLVEAALTDYTAEEIEPLLALLNEQMRAMIERRRKP